MTRQKSFKRLVRARMAETGESSTTARAMLLAAREPEQASAEPMPATWVVEGRRGVLSALPRQRAGQCASREVWPPDPRSGGSMRRPISRPQNRTEDTTILRRWPESL